VLDLVAFAEFNHPPNSLDRQLRLLRAGLVIEAAVQNTAVVAGLVASGASFLFEYENLGARMSQEKFMRGSQSHDAGTDDCYFHPDSRFMNMIARLLVM
jgi:hypothetical protein